MKSLIDIEAVIGDDAPKTIDAQELEAILQMAWLASVADDELGGEEVDAYRRAAEKLGGASMTKARMNALTARFAKEAGESDRSVLVTAAAAKLTRPEARDLCFKVVYAMNLSDIATHRAEAAFEEELATALGLCDEDVEVLSDGVAQVLLADDGT